LFRALESQTYPKNLYDVIVDNASDEDIESVVSQFGQALTTRKSRLICGWNKGISLAKGDVIAFTDADCIRLRIGLRRV